MFVQNVFQGFWQLDITVVVIVMVDIVVTMMIIVVMFLVKLVIIVVMMVVIVMSVGMRTGLGPCNAAKCKHQRCIDGEFGFHLELL